MKTAISLLSPWSAALVIAVVGAAVAPAAEAAQAIPDFNSDNLGWHSRTVATMPPPKGTPGAHGPIGNHPDHPHFANNSGRQPTPRIGNDTHPLLQPWAAQVIRAANEKVLAGGERFSMPARCWQPGVPGILTFTAEPVLLLQTPKEITMIYQRGQIVRHIFMNEAHPANLKPSWMGHSIGHYEGDELVIDTVGIDPRSFTDEFGTPHTDRMHVVERYRMIMGGPDLITVDHIPADRYFVKPENRVLRVLATIDDPGTFKAPYTVMQVYEKATEPFEESICQENNDDKFNQGLVPVPQDTTADF